MATITDKLSGKSNRPDVTTPAGFLAVYDEHADRLRRDKRWCSGGHAYAYSGSEDGGITHRIPAPGNRGTMDQQLRLQSLPREYLTEAGLAAAEAETGELLAVLRRGAVEAARRGITEGYLTIAQANVVMHALGIGDFTEARSHNGFVTGTRYFTSPRQLTTEERQRLHEAVDAAVNGALATFAEILTPDGNNQHFEIGSDRGASTRPIAPAL